MKTILLSSLILISSLTNCRGSVPTIIVTRFRLINQLIESGNATELSKLTAYPLKRKNPLPDIQNPADFIAHYSSLFDNSLKNLMKQYNDSDIFEHNSAYGLVGGPFSGQLWLNEDGKITGLIISEVEQKEKQALVAKIKAAMNPSVNVWNENVVVGRSEKLLIRIDRTDKGLRYACWSKGKTIKDLPDIVLYNGVEEQQGTMGGWTWTFKNNEWTYVVDDVAMGETAEQCGLFLELSYKKGFQSRTGLTEIK